LSRRPSSLRFRAGLNPEVQSPILAIVGRERQRTGHGSDSASLLWQGKTKNWEVNRMLQIRADSLRDVEDALARYEAEVQSSHLAPTTKRTYVQHAASFVAWLKGEFEPGSRV
jgi:hypothetical protein